MFKAGDIRGQRRSVCRATFEVVGVGVTLEVRLHRFVAGVNKAGEAEKNPSVGGVRRGVRKFGRRAPGALEKGPKKFEKFVF